MLLRDERGWRIAQLQPPDLSIDEPTPPLAPVRIPPSAQRAARLFAVAYADYRAGVRSRVTGLTSIALGQLRTDEDGLAQTPLPRAGAHLDGVRYGPLQSGRVAATATVTVAARRVQFSFLMTLTPRGWRCGAFL